MARVVKSKTMPRLLHHRLDPASRLARLMLAEYGIAVELDDIKLWSGDERLTEIDPTAHVPVLVIEEEEAVAIGALATIHAIEEAYAPKSVVVGLFPVTIAERAEMWRVTEWVLGKFNDEVTRYLIEEKIAKREVRGASLDVGVLRVAKANLNEHLQYFNWIFATRRWIAGDAMTLADFALAAHLSTLDYLGDIDWSAAGEVRDWYARIKSRPAFRTLLTDRVSGMLPHAGYADLDF